MTDTPTGAEGTDTEPTDIDDLDSALEAAWGSTEEDEVEDSLADEDVADEDEDDTDSDADDEVDDAKVEDEDSEDDTDESDDTEVQKFTVKVDGEELEVTLEEALAGYQRTADYTRKTQALSQERERYAAFEALEEALRGDPQDTLSKLARLYGVDIAGDQANQEVDDPLADLEPELAAEIREMRQLRQEWQADREARAAAERSAAIDAEIDAVRTKFNDQSLDEAALLEFAIDNGITNLEAAYKARAFEQAQAEAAKPKVKAVERKRKAPPVEGGRNRSKGVTKGIDPLDMSIDQAFELALSEHG